MSKTNTDGLYENFVLVQLNVTRYGQVKSCTDLAEEGAAVLAIDPERAKASIALVDESVLRWIDKPVRLAREAMKEMTVPWEVPRNNANGSRVSGAKYLLDHSKIGHYQNVMSGYRRTWEERLKIGLYDRWESMRAWALTELNGRFQDHFIPVHELREHYTWNDEPELLREVTDIANSDDIRLKAPRELVERCVEEARRSQANKIANAVGSLADDVMQEANDIVEGIDSYTFHEGDNRKGNYLPKAKGWQKLEKLADRIDGFTKALSDEDLTEASGKIRSLVSDIRDLGGGSLKDARAQLQGEDDSERQIVKEKLTDIKDAASPAMSKLEDFLK